MVYRGLVKDGVVIPETGVAFRDGTVVNIEPAEPTSSLDQRPTYLPELATCEELDRLLGGFRSHKRQSHQLLDVL
jgi:hypothetical protein